MQGLSEFDCLVHSRLVSDAGTYDGNLMDLCAFELVALVKMHTVSPADIMAACLQRIKERNPSLNGTS